MKITRIQRIRNHRIFRDFSWPKDLADFDRFNLIYGWNGSGKTTLSDLFRNLSAKQPIVDGEYEFQIDQRMVKSTNIESASVPPIRIFNRNSIDASVFETVGSHLSPIYFLGEDSVEKQKQVEALKGDLAKAEIAHIQTKSKHQAAQSDFESFCTDQARIIRELLTAPGSSYNNYDKRNFKDAANGLKKENYARVILDERQKKELRAAKDGKPKPKVQAVQAEYPDLVELTGETQRLLGQSVVSRVLDELAGDLAVASWVATGLILHTGEHSSETCRFCGKVVEKERIKRLEEHFNDDFKRFQTELSNLVSRIEAAKDEVEGMHFPESSLLYDHLTSDYEAAVSAFALHRNGIKRYLDALLDAAVAKRESPFKAVALLPFFGGGPSEDGEPIGVLGTIFSVVMAGVGALGAMQGQELLNKIEAAVETHNKLTDNYNEGIIRARKSLENNYVGEAFEKYLQKRDAIDDCESAKDAAVNAEKELRHEIAGLLREIKQHHRPAAELTQELGAYLNRSELAFVAHDNGYSITRNELPATHLSEGERMSIAFLYFLKSLQDTNFELSNGIVVIDDPVSSLDENALYSAFGFMKERTKDAGQLFVLTHNFAFFRMVRNWFHNLPKPQKKAAKFYMLTSSDTVSRRTAGLYPLDSLLRDYESEYHYLFKRVFDEANSQAGNGELAASYSMPNVARRVLEAFLAFRVPGKARDLYQQFEQIEFEPAKKARILRFVNTHSHFKEVAEPEHDLSVLAETRPVLQDVLALIEKTDPEHYRHMLALVSPQEGKA